MSNRNWLTLTTVLLVLGLLYFGMRPKDWSLTNEVHWLTGKNALHFKHPGIAYLSDLNTSPSGQNPKEFTIHMSVAPENLLKLGFKPMMMIHNGDDQEQLTIWNWGKSIIVMNGDDYSHHRKLPRISALDVLTPDQENFITVTSSATGTHLFVNGIPVSENRKWSLALPENNQKLQLVLGNSVYGKHSWEGNFYSLALYGKSFSPEEVRVYYASWVAKRQLPEIPEDNLLLLYTFTEEKGELVADKSGHNQPLLIPPHSATLKKAFLSTPWHNFKPTQSFFLDTLLNFIGFIPLGGIVYVKFQQASSFTRKYSVLITIACCFLLSLSMEILQAWLPSRSSSLLDLLLNTIGGGTGVLLASALSGYKRNECHKTLQR